MRAKEREAIRARLEAAPMRFLDRVLVGHARDPVERDAAAPVEVLGLVPGGVVELLQKRNVFGPLCRELGQDIAEGVRYLASDESDYVTGHLLEIDPDDMEWADGGSALNTSSSRKNQVSETTISSRPYEGHRPILRIAPTPPGGGLPSRSHEAWPTSGPAHRRHDVASSSNANTRSGGASERAVTSYEHRDIAPTVQLCRLCSVVTAMRALKIRARFRR
jgi:hypothetical protein